eukprot:816929-Pyramimonas_sp.AAC.1
MAQPIMHLMDFLRNPPGVSSEIQETSASAASPKEPSGFMDPNFFPMSSPEQNGTTSRATPDDVLRNAEDITWSLKGR